MVKNLPAMQDIQPAIYPLCVKTLCCYTCTKSCPTLRDSFNPWVRKIPWRRKWKPTSAFLPGEANGQRSLMGYSPWGLRGGTTEPLSLSKMVYKDMNSESAGLYKKGELTEKLALQQLIKTTIIIESEVRTLFHPTTIVEPNRRMTFSFCLTRRQPVRDCHDTANESHYTSKCNHSRRLFLLYPASFSSLGGKKKLFLLCCAGLACGLPQLQISTCNSLLIIKKPNFALEITVSLFF